MDKDHEPPTDILLNELQIDDYVIYTSNSYNNLDVGKIVDIRWDKNIARPKTYRPAYLVLVSLQRHKSRRIISPSNCYKVEKEIFCQYRLKHPFNPPPFTDN